MKQPLLPGNPRGAALVVLAGLFLSLPATEARKSSPPPRPASLWEDAFQQTFTDGLDQLLRETKQLAFEQRHQRVWRFLDGILQRIGVPKDPDTLGHHRIDFVLTQTTPLDGVFNPSRWIMTINEKLLTAGPLSRDQVVRLADILGHELGHAEQSFRMACWLVDRGRTSELADLGVSAHILAEAQRPARPKLDKARARQAERWYAHWIAPEHRQNAIALGQARREQGRAQRTLSRLQAELQVAEKRRPPAAKQDLHERRKAIEAAAKDLVAWQDKVKQLHEASEKLPLDRQCQRIGHVLGERMAKRFDAGGRP